MPQPKSHNSDAEFSTGHAILQSQEPLPPYELDPHLDEPAIRKRIGEVIARAVDKMNPRRWRR
jgi:hypothetical protein